MVNDADCVAVFDNVLQAGAPSIEAVADVNAVDKSTSDFATFSSGDDCTYYYTGETALAGATVATFVYDTETGQVTQATAAIP